MRSLFSYFSRRQDRARRAAEHYSALVNQARRPEFYEGLGTPDTLDGRFDLIVLHASLYLRRLRGAGREGRDLAQAVFDQMFVNLDESLRELGVSDMTLAKKMRKMVSAFYGRAAAYDKALNDADDGELGAALARNLYRGTPPGLAAVVALSTYLREAAKALASTPDDAMLANHFRWASPPSL